MFVFSNLYIRLLKNFTHIWVHF